MRALATSELSFVSGGAEKVLEEVVVSGKRMSKQEIQLVMDWLNSRATAMDGGGGGKVDSDVLEEVVITDSKITDDDRYLTYEACLAAAGLVGHHIGDNLGKWAMAQLMRRAGAVAGSVVGPGGAVVGGVAGYHLGAEWGEKHGGAYGAATGILIGSQVCPKN